MLHWHNCVQSFPQITYLRRIMKHHHLRKFSIIWFIDVIYWKKLHVIQSFCALNITIKIYGIDKVILINTKNTLKSQWSSDKEDNSLQRIIWVTNGNGAYECWGPVFWFILLALPLYLWTWSSSNQLNCSVCFKKFIKPFTD